MRELDRLRLENADLQEQNAALVAALARLHNAYMTASTMVNVAKFMDDAIASGGPLPPKHKPSKSDTEPPSPSYL